MSEIPTFEPIPPADEPPAAGSTWGKAHHVLLLFLGCAVIVWLLSGIYRVNANERAIVERMGAYISNSQGEAIPVEQGLHYAYPWPIERVYKVPVQEYRTLVLNTFNASPDANAEYRRDMLRLGYKPEHLSAIFDPYLITGDKNVVHVEIAVQYRIKDPQPWLTAISHTDAAGASDERQTFMENMIAHALIKTLARMPVDHVLFEHANLLPGEFKTAIVEALKIPDPSHPGKFIEFGLDILKVDVTERRVPPLVKPAFDAVLQAANESSIENDRAKADAETMIAQAKGERERLIRDATAYAKQKTEGAEGEKSRFELVLGEYRKAPDITRYRVFTDMISEVLGRADRIFWVQPGQKLTITIDPPKFDAGQVK